MTTAHRPTFFSAKGGKDQGGNKLIFNTRQFSARDLPGQLHIKNRDMGQGNEEELKDKDFRTELLEKETKYNESKETRKMIESNNKYWDKDVKALEHELDDEDVEKYANGYKRQKLDDVDLKLKTPFPQDVDEELSSDSDEKEKDGDVDEENSSDDSDDGSDNDFALLREFAKVKREREEEQRRIELEKLEEEKLKRQEEVMYSNPLLNATSYSLKKRWSEDTVFKNQAKNLPKEKKRFVNDTVRSDFHRKFISKYIQ